MNFVRTRKQSVPVSILLLLSCGALAQEPGSISPPPHIQIKSARVKPAKVTPAHVVPASVKPARIIKNADGTRTIVPPQVTPSQITFPTVTPPEITSPDIHFRDNGKQAIFEIQAEVLFDFDKSNIRPDADAALQQISRAIHNHYPNAGMEIDGHTDSKGSVAYNIGLSQRRANSVKQWLLTKGSLSNAMTTRGFGKARPVAPNTLPNGGDNPAGRQKNRRVEIIAFK